MERRTGPSEEDKRRDLSRQEKPLGQRGLKGRGMDRGGGRGSRACVDSPVQNLQAELSSTHAWVINNVGGN